MNMPSSLRDDEVDAYSRQIALRDIGIEGQERLRSGRAAIIGMGGLGTPAAMLLARMGIGYLKLIDRDIVSRTDLHRQVLYCPDDVGLPKVEVARRELLRINPFLEVEAVAAPLMRKNALELIRGVDVVIDGLDSMRARYLLNRAVLNFGVPYVFSAAVEMFGAVSTIIPGETPCLECFYSGLRDELLPRCAQVGVHPSLTLTAAAFSVSEAVKLITGKEPSLKGKLLLIDLRNLEFTTLGLRKNASCPACSRSRGLEDLEDLPEIELSCSRDGRNVYFINSPHELDLDEVAERVRGMGWSLLERGDQYLKFFAADLSCTVMRSGSMVIELGRVDFSTDSGIKLIKKLIFGNKNS